MPNANNSNLEDTDTGAKPAGGGRKGHVGASSSGWDWDSHYVGKDPVDRRPILNARINGGISSPSRWDQKTQGYVGTDRAPPVPPTVFATQQRG